MFTNRNRHELLPEIDFKLTIIMSLSGIKNLANNVHFIFLSTIDYDWKDTGLRYFRYQSALYRSCAVTFLQD
ncbi:Uncharacterised protein [Salmonella enterica]|uniref:Uncharacterized protein n=1 Tax=Salmonella enterica TaxID=28901 RepID=A0A379Q828_SALER|nr:hypothetical protein [Salmonella enterica subsp. salamae serovar Springs]SUF37884.1 Uncharacterised protein [Salmonella enterica]